MSEETDLSEEDQGLLFNFVYACQTLTQCKFILNNIHARGLDVPAYAFLEACEKLLTQQYQATFPKTYQFFQLPSIWREYKIVKTPSVLKTASITESGKIIDNGIYIRQMASEEPQT